MNKVAKVGDKIKFRSIRDPSIIREFTVIMITDHVVLLQTNIPNLYETEGIYKHQETLMIHNGKIISDYSMFYQICDNSIKFIKCS